MVLLLRNRVAFRTVGINKRQWPIVTHTRALNVQLRTRTFVGGPFTRNKKEMRLHSILRKKREKKRNEK